MVICQTVFRMPRRVGVSSDIAADLIGEFARLGQSALGCWDAAKLLSEIEALAARAPCIQVPAACSALDTFKSVPFLMRGRFRLWRLRLLWSYLHSIRSDVRRRLTCRADELVFSGRWASYVAVKVLLWRFNLHLALLSALGILFVFYVPVRFEPVCARLIRLLGD